MQCPPLVKGISASREERQYLFFFLFSLSAILIGWRKRRFITLPFTTMATLVFMARKVSFQTKIRLTIVKPDDYYYVLCCITDLHTVSFKVSHNCLDSTDGVSVFILPYFPRISTSPEPLLPPDSLTLILLCYYPAPSSGCFIFYFLPQYYGLWVVTS